MREVVKVTISLPSDLLQLADETAQAEHRNRVAESFVMLWRATSRRGSVKR